jgi:predicted TIM-barrel fold metal-dependent hydrolase
MASLQKPVDYAVVDADNHYYEPLDLFETYIDPKYRDRTFKVESTGDGFKQVVFDGRPFGFVGGAGQRQRIRPGALRKRLRDALPDDDPDVDDSYASDPDARLALMTEQGIEATFMFPSTGVTLENRLDGDPELLMAHFEAFNRWLAETWGFARGNRIFSAAPMSLVDVDFAVAQLESVVAAGARLVQLLPGPATWGRSPADPIYDPFWARVNESGVVVTFHLGNSGYQERYSGDWGEHADPDGLRGDSPGRSAFQWIAFYRDRPIMETLCNLIYRNLFGRFPELKVASVENGAIWVPYLLKAMDNMKGMGRTGPWPDGYVNGKFSEVFKQHVFVNPHHFGDDLGELVDLLGAGQVLYGSDFPHAEGMSDVSDYHEQAEALAGRLGRDDEVTRMVMRENGLRLLGLV